MLIFLNSVLNFNFFCFDAWILISNEESDENNVWFGYDIQNTSGFHLGFHWVSKLMHVTNLAIFYWLSNLWIINEFEKITSNRLSSFGKKFEVYSLSLCNKYISGSVSATISEITGRCTVEVKNIEGAAVPHFNLFSPVTTFWTPVKADLSRYFTVSHCRMSTI